MNATLPPDRLPEFRALWQDYRPTPLMEFPTLARLAGVGRVFVKYEGARPLANFKVLGGMIASLRALARVAGDIAATSFDAVRIFSDMGRVATELRSRSDRLPDLICASAGNHGLAVAAAAAWAGVRAKVYLPTTANRARARRIESIGGEIVWIVGSYDDAVQAAADAAGCGKGLLIPDTSPDINDVVVRDVMAGYSVLTQELVAQLQDVLARARASQTASHLPSEVSAGQLADAVRPRPTHVFIQAGVGGLAAAVAEGLSGHLLDPRKIVVVEPEAAGCVARALAAGEPVRLSGDLHTSAEMLCCGLASARAVEILKRHSAASILVSEPRLQSTVDLLRAECGIATTASGATGLAGLLHACECEELRAEHQLRADSIVLAVVTEGIVPEG